MGVITGPPFRPVGIADETLQRLSGTRLTPQRRRTEASNTAELASGQIIDRHQPLADGVEIDVIEELGADAFLYGSAVVEGKKTDVIARIGSISSLRSGDKVYLKPQGGITHLFDTASGLRLNSDAPAVAKKAVAAKPAAKKVAAKPAAAKPTVKKPAAKKAAPKTVAAKKPVVKKTK